MAKLNISEWGKSPWYWVFWTLLALGFMVFDLLTGSLFLAGFMLGLSMYYIVNIIDTVVARQEAKFAEKLKALKEEETNGIQGT